MSATVIARSVAAMPKRDATEAWGVIVKMIAPDPRDPARQELAKVAAVAASIIAADSPKDEPIVLWGGGPRMRIYCLYNDDAIQGQGVSEDPVRQKVTGDGWQMSLPCDEDDLEWIQRSLKALSSRVSARKLGDQVPEDDASGAERATAAGTSGIDLTEFFKP